MTSLGPTRATIDNNCYSGLPSIHGHDDHEHLPAARDRRGRKAPRVVRDLTDHYVFLGQDNPNVAERFLAAADETFEQLARMPEVGSPRDSGRSELSGLRMFRIRGFERHLVFYRPIEGGVEIVRVLHSVRDLATLFEE